MRVWRSPRWSCVDPDQLARPVEHQFIGAGQAAGAGGDAGQVEAQRAGVEREQQRRIHQGRHDHEQVEDRQAGRRHAQAQQIGRILLFGEGVHMGAGAQRHRDLLRVVEFARDCFLAASGADAVDEALFVIGQGLGLDVGRQARHGALECVEVFQFAHAGSVPADGSMAFRAGSEAAANR
jgi:hypothetical protein